VWADIEKAVIVKSAQMSIIIIIKQINKKKQITRVTIFRDKKCVPIGSQTSLVADVRKCLYTVVIMIYGSHMAMAIVVVTAMDNILNASFLMTSIISILVPISLLM
jgi:hypothetical protein